MELYFFRNISNYNELKAKTDHAYKIRSVNKRKVMIVKTIELVGEKEEEFFWKLQSDNQFVIENLELMKIKDGVWHCIEMVENDKSLLVMSDGYPYAKFVALKSLN